MVIQAGKVRMLIYEKKLTQSSLAKEINVSRATINNICRGSSCSEKTARRIADALGVTLEEIKR